MKILIAEDSRSLMLTTSVVIRQTGNEVLQAFNGTEALSIYEQDPPDLILLDVEMPGLTGFEVAEKIRSQKSEKWIPIIFLTSHKDEDYLTKGLDIGGDDYLIKPVSSVVLKAKINAMQRIYEMQSKLISLTDNLIEANKSLSHSANTDPLTGAKNRLYMEKSLENEWQKGMSIKTELSLMVLDLDNFKTLNDKNGHQAGDDCLIEIVKIIDQHLNRTTDILCRYGGDEFILLLPDTDSNYALKIAEKVRVNVEDFSDQFKIPHPVDIRASIGCATYVPDVNLSADELLTYADKALYAAKEKGRNCVVQATIPNKKAA